MQAFTKSVFEVFGAKKRYLVPMFQRPYVWSREKQWEPLWEDVRAKALEHLQDSEPVDPHFLGAVVIHQMPVFGPQIPAHQVIDGQQRLTTFQIFLSALRDICRKAGQNEIADELRTHTLNSGKKAAPEEELKVWPTSADQEPFTRCMKVGGKDELEEIYPAQVVKRKLIPRPALVEAYLYFSEELHDFLTDGDRDICAERLDALFQALQNSLTLVSIELESRDDPQVIFETLNARGEPLLSSDLLRNYIFLRARREGAAADELYRQYWEHFDTRSLNLAQPALHFWKVEERQGRLLRPRLDLFIQHLLSLKTSREVNVGRLFHDYKRWIETAQPFASVEQELRELNRYAEVFARFFVDDDTSVLGQFLLRFQRLLDTSTIFPLLLYLCADSGLHVEDLQRSLRMLESYVVRRIVCGLSEKNYNLLFLRLMRALRDTPGRSSTTLRDLLLALEGDGQWPDDQRFAQEWLRRPIYRSSRSQPRIEAMLRAIEQAQSTDLGEAIHIQGPLTIEHVMPQAWEEHWPLPDGADPAVAEPAREDLLHTFGNLTLLTHKLNASLSNGPFTAKRPEIAKQSKLGLNAWFQTQSGWDEGEIQRRGKALLQTALLQWQHPSSASAPLSREPG